MLGKVEQGRIILTDQGGEPACEKLGAHANRVDITDGVRVAPNQDGIVLVGGVRDALGVSEDAHYVVPQAGELGAVVGIREDLGTALGWGGQPEGLTNSGSEGRILRADGGVCVGGTSPATGNLGLVGHG